MLGADRCSPDLWKKYPHPWSEFSATAPHKTTNILGDYSLLLCKKEYERMLFWR